MEQVIVGIVSLILVVVLYQERARRADAAALRRDMNEGFAALRAEFKEDAVVLRDELKGDIRESRGEIAALRDELRGEIVALRDELKGDIRESRGEVAALRSGFKGDVVVLRDDLDREIVATRQELKEEMKHGFSRTDRRIDNLTTSVLALAESVGQVKGRTEVLKATG